MLLYGRTPFKYGLFLLASILTAFTLISNTKDFAASDYAIYKNNLESGVSSWSWNSTLTWNNANPYTSSSYSIKFVPTSYGGLYFHLNNTLDLSSYASINFNIYAVNSSQRFKLVIYDNTNKSIKSVSLATPSVNTWKKYSIAIKDLGLSTTKINGIAIQENANVSGVKSYVDDVIIKVSSTTTTPTPTPTPTPRPTTTTPSPTPVISATPTPTPTPVPTKSATPTPTPVTVSGTGYTVSGQHIYKDGSRFTIKGINWFGFEDSTHVVHGLWARNYKDVVAQIKSMGFNSVRIPFCPATVHGASTTSISYSLNPDLSGLNSIQVLDKIVNELNNNQIYILLDHHRPDCAAISNLWYTSSYSESQWISDLTTLASRYKDKAYFMGMDLKNEPHGNATWGTGNTSTDWNLAAEKAGKAILAANSRLLIFVEGVGENPTCSDSYGHWQGGNLNPVNCKGISTSAIPADKLVLSPHVYGPDVYVQSYFNNSTFPSNLSPIWDLHFGSLTSKGYTIVPGEWGGKYGNGGLASDKTWQDAMKAYFIKKGICNTYYWDLNPNSGDTGGILQDDWKTPWSNKLSMLQNFFSSCVN